MNASAQRGSPGSRRGRARGFHRQGLRSLLACVLVATALPPVIMSQERSDQWNTLKGIDTLGVSVGSVLPEALRAGLSADSLEHLMVEILQTQGVPAVGQGRAVLKVDVSGFAFGGRISYSVKLALWQSVILVASGRITVAETWSERRDDDAEEAEFGEACSRTVRSLIERFLKDYELANPSP